MMGHFKNQKQDRLERITGIPVRSQRILQFGDESDPSPIGELNDDDKPLGFYGLQDWQVLKVTHLNSILGRDRCKSLHRW